jgi:hypothetical protein
MMNGVDEKNDEFLEVEEGDSNKMITGEDQIDEYGLSLNALAENYAHNTIKIKENCQNKNLIIIIDSVSAHSFIDEYLLKEIRTTMEKRPLC